MNKAARNERRKITATWFNGAAIAAVAVGGFAPITGYVTAARTPISPGLLAGLVACWIIVSGALHLVARWFAGKVEE